MNGARNSLKNGDLGNFPGLGTRSGDNLLKTRLHWNITLVRAYLLGTASAKLRLRGPRRLPAELAGRTIQRESAMADLFSCSSV